MSRKAGKHCINLKSHRQFANASGIAALMMSIPRKMSSQKMVVKLQSTTSRYFMHFLLLLSTNAPEGI